MTIDLVNFFMHFDSKNPKHIESVKNLASVLTLKQPDLLEDNSEWIKIYRSKPESPKSNVLNVPFFPQTDNYRDADRTCNSSSCAMCLEFLKPGTLKGAKGDDEYVKKVFAIGDSPSHDVQTRVLSGYGLNSVFRTNVTYADIDAELAAGRPVVAAILHRGSRSAPTGGHICVIIGKTDSGDYVVNDPYGSLNDGYTGSVMNGKGAVYKKAEWDARWLLPGQKVGWARFFKP